MDGGGIRVSSNETPEAETMSEEAGVQRGEGAHAGERQKYYLCQ